MTETYYTVLGVPRSASVAEIKAAYLELIRQVHPDTIPNAPPYWRKQAEERSKDINEAYQVLSNPEKRRLYDKQIDAYQQAQRPQTQAAPSPNNSQANQAQTSQGSAAPPRATTSTGGGTAPGPATRPVYSPANGWWRPASPISTPFKVLWSIFCLIWGGTWSLALFDSTDSLSHALFAFIMAFGSFGWAAWIAARPIGRILTRFGITKLHKQVYATCAAIALALCSILAIGDVANQSPRSQSGSSASGRIVLAPNESSLQPGYVRARGSEGKVWDIPKDKWLEAIRRDPGLTVLLNSPSGPPQTLPPNFFEKAQMKPPRTLPPEFFEEKGVRQTLRKPQKPHAAGPDRSQIGAAENSKPLLPSNEPTPSAAKSETQTGDIFDQLPTQQHVSKSEATSDNRTLGPRGPDVSRLSNPERQSLEAACSQAKYLQGPASYRRCIEGQLAKLASGPRRPDLSQLDETERQSIEAACSQAKYLEGPAAYNRCLETQLAQLATAPRRPDLSHLSEPERQSIEAVCSQAKYLQGPAAYNRCLTKQLQDLQNSN